MLRKFSTNHVEGGTRMSDPKSFRLTCLLATAGGALGAFLPAHAQEVTQNAEGLEEVVVTATKRATNLQDTAIAISVMNADQLADRHVKALYDLADGSIPSLRVAT